MVKKHDANNIVLLCSVHHQDETSRRINIRDIQEFIDSPHNHRTGSSTPHLLLLSKRDLSIKVASNHIRVVGPVENIRCDFIAFDDYVPFAFEVENGHYYLSVELRNDEGNVCFKIDRNELCVMSDAVDFSVEGPRISCMTKNDNFAVIDVNDENSVVIKEFQICYRGVFMFNQGRDVYISRNFPELQVACFTEQTVSIGQGFHKQNGVIRVGTKIIEPTNWAVVLGWELS